MSSRKSIKELLRLIDECAGEQPAKSRSSWAPLIEPFEALGKKFPNMTAKAKIAKLIELGGIDPQDRKHAYDGITGVIRRKAKKASL